MKLPTPNPIERINALTTNARNTWFALLAVLVFVGITLMSVEHIDFYGVNRATTLPLVNVEVPTRYFFVAAPILTAAIYGYFHLYLIRLWDAVARAPENIGGEPVGEVVSPWLITDAAFYMRNLMREDGSARHRLLEGTAMALNILLAWGFGLLVLAFLWWLSMPARAFWMTAISAASLFGASFVGFTSLALMISRMRNGPRNTQSHVFASLPAMIIFIVALPFLAALSYQRTEGSTARIAPIDLTGEAIVERPPGWKPYQLARTDFFAEWCKREHVSCKANNLTDDQKSDFKKEWKSRRRIQLSDLSKPDWNKDTSTLDFRNAILNGVFLVDKDFSEAKFDKAKMIQGNFEGSTFFKAKMSYASFLGANLEATRFDGAWLANANLSHTQIDDAGFYGAILYKARLAGMQSRRTVFSNAYFQEANIIWAKVDDATIQDADFSRANLRYTIFQNSDFQRSVFESANLHGAKFIHVDLLKASLEKADLTYGYLDSATRIKHGFFETNFTGAVADGAAIRFADMTTIGFNEQTDFRNVFVDGTVMFSESFKSRLGDQCQSSENEVLTDAVFWGRWRGWIEHRSNRSFPRPSWSEIAPKGFEDISPIPPPNGCEWKTGPLALEAQSNP